MKKYRYKYYNHCNLLPQERERASFCKALVALATTRSHRRGRFLPEELVLNRWMRVGMGLGLGSGEWGWG